MKELVYYGFTIKKQVGKKIIMEEKEINGKIAVKQKQISVELNSEKKKIMQSELLKLRLRLELLKAQENISNLKNN